MQSISMTKADRLALIYQRNAPPRLTPLEEGINAVTHGLGGVLAAGGLALLLLHAKTPLEQVAAYFYGVSMVVMLLMSGLYHAMPAASTAKRVLRRVDYASIYLLIGGTFAPLLLVCLGGTLGITLFCVQWGVILFGVSLIALFGPGRWKPLHYTLYFLIGWSGLALLPALYGREQALVWAILLGGVAYTVGMVPFALHKKYSHCVWHLFVLLAAGVHWVGIYRCLY